MLKPIHKHILLAAGFLLYALVFHPVTHAMGPAAPLFSIFLAVLAGYFYGVGAGILISFVILPVNFFLLHHFGHPLAIVRITMLSVVSALVAALVGHQRTVSVQLGTEVFDRKHAEEILEQATATQRRLQLALDYHAIVAITDDKGRITYANDKFCVVSGYPRDELIGQDHRMLNSHLHPASLFADLWATIQAGRVWKGTVRNHTKQGSYYWVDNTIVPFFDRAGKTERYVSIATDITERKLAEDKLRESEEKYRSLVDNAPEIIMTVDLDDRITFVNRTPDPVTGRRIVGAKIYDLVAPDSTETARQTFATIKKSHTPGSYETYTTGSDGIARWYATHVSPILNGGEVTGFTLLARDITESRRVAEAMRESEAREAAQLQNEKIQQMLIESYQRAEEEWRVSFDTIHFPVLVSSEKGVVVRANSAGDEFYSLDFSADAAIRAAILTHEPGLTMLACFGHAARERTPFKDRAADPATGKSWDIEATPFTSVRGENMIILVCQDITDIVRLQDRLSREEAMAALGRIVAGVSHEVRNPLFGISAAIDAMELEFRDVPGFAEYLVPLRANGARLTRLVHLLLNYAKPAKLERLTIDPETVIRLAIGNCVPLAQKLGVSLVQEPGDAMPPICIDVERFSQALQNIIENAVQHSPPGGTVRAGVRRAEGPSGEFVFTVTDEGPGFRPEDAARLFEPFFTRRRGGTGLGLSIVKRIVELHGGSISVFNREGGGAAFEIRIKTEGEG